MNLPLLLLRRRLPLRVPAVRALSSSSETPAPSSLDAPPPNAFATSRNKYRKHVSSLRSRYAADYAREVAAAKAQDEASAADAARSRAERRHLRNLRSLEGARRDLQQKADRAVAFQTELAAESVRRAQREARSTRARELCLAELEAAAVHWYTDADAAHRDLEAAGMADDGLWDRAGSVVGVAPDAAEFWRYGCATYHMYPRRYATLRESLRRSAEDFVRERGLDLAPLGPGRGIIPRKAYELHRKEAAVTALSRERGREEIAKVTGVVYRRKAFEFRKNEDDENDPEPDLNEYRRAVREGLDEQLGKMWRAVEGKALDENDDVHVPEEGLGHVAWPVLLGSDRETQEGEEPISEEGVRAMFIDAVQQVLVERQAPVESFLDLGLDPHAETTAGTEPSPATLETVQTQEIIKEFAGADREELQMDGPGYSNLIKAMSRMAEIDREDAAALQRWEEASAAAAAAGAASDSAGADGADGAAAGGASDDDGSDDSDVVLPPRPQKRSTDELIRELATSMDMHLTAEDVEEMKTVLNKLDLVEGLHEEVKPGQEEFDEERMEKDFEALLKVGKEMGMNEQEVALAVREGMGLGPGKVDEEEEKKE